MTVQGERDSSAAAAAPRPSTAEPVSAFERRVRAGRKSWRCFHCGEVFLNPKHAAAHFGLEQFQEPGCVQVLRHGEDHLLGRILELQEDLRRYEDESAHMILWQHAKAGEHARAVTRAEEEGYAKGVRDTLAMPEAERAALSKAQESSADERDGAAGPSSGRVATPSIKPSGA